MANNSMLMPLQIERQYSGSLDANFSFDTLEELKNYATTSALSYSGQILYCEENDTLYKVNSDKTNITSLDSRQSVETLDDLLSLDTNVIDNGTEVYVQDLDCKYRYHENYNEEDTGKWKLYEIPEMEILTEEDIFEALGMSEEELEGLSQIIDDEQVSESKAWSSSKIYEEIEKLKNQGGLGGDAVDIGYENESFPDYTNVGIALDSLFAKVYYIKPTCSLSASVNGGNFEKGTIISVPITFTWTTNKPITSQTLTDCVLVDETVRTATYDASDITTDKTFTLSVSDSENSATSSVSYKFMNKIHFGCCVVPATYDSNFILGLTNGKLTSSNKATYSFNCGDGEYAYFATPEGMKITSAWVNGFQADLEEVATIEHTNASGHTSSYTISRFSNSGLGSFSAEVK